MGGTGSCIPRPSSARRAAHLSHLCRFFCTCGTSNKNRAAHNGNLPPHNGNLPPHNGNLSSHNGNLSSHNGNLSSRYAGDGFRYATDGLGYAGKRFCGGCRDLSDARSEGHAIAQRMYKSARPTNGNRRGHHSISPIGSIPFRPTAPGRCGSGRSVLRATSAQNVICPDEQSGGHSDPGHCGRAKKYHPRQRVVGP
jgi:hypothetical protein